MNKEHKVALITGANKGIGLETARQLGQLGITVILGARDRARGEQATEMLSKEGISAHFVHLDMEQPSHFQEVYHFIDTHYGHLDILVNNAGVNLEEEWGSNTTPSTSPSVLRRTFDINFFGLVELTQVLLPLIRKSPAGRIVNLSSILGSLTYHATPGSPIYDSKAFAYNVSKTALNQFTVHLAHALRDTSIKVNSAHPGWVKTDLGTEHAPMEIPDGAKTSVTLATLPTEGPTGGYYHSGESLPW